MFAHISDFPEGSSPVVRVAWTDSENRPSGVVLTAEKSATFQLQVTYDRKAAVIEARAKGDLPEENAGLAKGQSWVRGQRCYIIGTKTGRVSLRVACTVAPNWTIVYKVNGQEVSRAAYEQHLPPSKRSGYCAQCMGKDSPNLERCADPDAHRKPAPQVLNIGTDKITKVTHKGHPIGWILDEAEAEDEDA